jgi:hypothetical protein
MTSRTGAMNWVPVTLTLPTPGLAVDLKLRSDRGGIYEFTGRSQSGRPAFSLPNDIPIPSYYTVTHWRSMGADNAGAAST